MDWLNRAKRQKYLIPRGLSLNLSVSLKKHKNDLNGCKIYVKLNLFHIESQV